MQIICPCPQGYTKLCTAKFRRCNFHQGNSTEYTFLSRLPCLCCTSSHYSSSQLWCNNMSLTCILARDCVLIYLLSFKSIFIHSLCPSTLTVFWAVITAKMHLTQLQYCVGTHLVWNTDTGLRLLLLHSMASVDKMIDHDWANQTNANLKLYEQQQ